MFNFLNYAISTSPVRIISTKWISFGWRILLSKLKNSFYFPIPVIQFFERYFGLKSSDNRKRSQSKLYFINQVAKIVFVYLIDLICVLLKSCVCMWKIKVIATEWAAHFFSLQKNNIPLKLLCENSPFAVGLQSGETSAAAAWSPSRAPHRPLSGRIISFHCGGLGQTGSSLEPPPVLNK